MAIRPDAPYNGWVLGGGLLAGWGLFNLAEGLLDHHILGLHHVREQPFSPGSWDLAFDVFSLVLLLAGGLAFRRGAGLKRHSKT